MQLAYTDNGRCTRGFKIMQTYITVGGGSVLQFTIYNKKILYSYDDANSVRNDVFMWLRMLCTYTLHLRNV